MILEQSEREIHELQNATGFDATGGSISLLT